MLKRQESVMSSSSHSENLPNNIYAHKSPQTRIEIGCMSGIFRLLSKYQTRRKFLTFGGKKQGSKEPKNNDSVTRKTISSSFSSSSKRKGRISSSSSKENTKGEEKIKVEDKKTKSEASLGISPNLPPEIRVSEFPENVKSIQSEIISAEVKRRKLVVALNKCDEDLKAISSIINDLSLDKKLSPHPNSAIFDPSRSFIIDRSSRFSCARVTRNEGILVQPKKSQPKKHFYEKVASGILRVHNVKRSTTLWSSKAKVESVDVVCRDLDWGIEREVGKIGLVLHDYICKDLIDEIVRELKECDSIVYLTISSVSLPRQACRRRLSF